MTQPHAEQTSQPARRGVASVVLREDRFLVICRSAHVVAPGAFCFPGGGIEPGESEAEALVREFREELGAELRPLRCVWRSTTRWQVELAWWDGVLAHDAQLRPNPAEVEAVHWLTAEQMAQRPELLESNRTFLETWAAGGFTLDRTPPCLTEGTETGD